MTRAAYLQASKAMKDDMMKLQFLSSPQIPRAPEFQGIKAEENGTNDQNNSVLMVLDNTPWYGLFYCG